MSISLAGIFDWIIHANLLIGIPMLIGGCFLIWVTFALIGDLFGLLMGFLEWVDKRPPLAPKIRVLVLIMVALVGLAAFVGLIFVASPPLGEWP